MTEALKTIYNKEIFTAIMDKRVSQVQTLLDEGLDPNDVDECNLLSFALKWGTLEIIKALIESGMEPFFINEDDESMDQNPWMMHLYFKSYENDKCPKSSEQDTLIHEIFMQRAKNLDFNTLQWATLQIFRVGNLNLLQEFLHLGASPPSPYQLNIEVTLFEMMQDFFDRTGDLDPVFKECLLMAHSFSEKQNLKNAINQSTKNQSPINRL